MKYLIQKNKHGHVVVRFENEEVYFIVDPKSVAHCSWHPGGDMGKDRIVLTFAGGFGAPHALVHEIPEDAGRAVMAAIASA